MSSAIAKKALFSQFAIVAKAMSHGHRLELLEFVAQGERSVDALARLADLDEVRSPHQIRKFRFHFLTLRSLFVVP